MLLRHCRTRKNYVFDNGLVKQVAGVAEFANPFDATKADHSYQLAKYLREKDVFILHLGHGRHKFVSGISNGYHQFEKIEQSNVFTWPYVQSILNEADESESNVLSIASNQNIMQHFLYDDKTVRANVYQSRRTKANFLYNIGNEQIDARNLQIEIDQTHEHQGNITVIEAKNGFPADFAVYQIYLPHLYYMQIKASKKLPIKQIRCCYLLREKQDSVSVLRFYLYRFQNPQDMATIVLEKSSEYRLVKQ